MVGRCERHPCVSPLMYRSGPQWCRHGGITCPGPSRSAHGLLVGDEWARPGTRLILQSKRCVITSTQTHTKMKNNNNTNAGCTDLFQYLQNEPLIHFSPLAPISASAPQTTVGPQSHNEENDLRFQSRRTFFSSQLNIWKNKIKSSLTCAGSSGRLGMVFFPRSLVEICRASSQIISNLLCGTLYVILMWQMLKEEEDFDDSRWWNTDRGENSNARFPQQPRLRRCYRIAGEVPIYSN